MTLLEGEIEEIVAGVVDSCLDGLGRGFKSIFYWSLENRVGVKRNEIASKPEEFVMYLEQMFPSNASYVKDEICNQLCRSLGIERECEDLIRVIRQFASY